MAYVFSRLTSSVQPDYAKIAASGAIIALNAEDPQIAQQIAAARQAGAKVAIWLPAHQGQDPVAYGRHMAALAQYYKPDAVLPNIEGAQGKASSGGSQWSNAMMGEYAKYMRPGDVKLDVVTEAGETDFDYKPYLNFGGGVVNEAFYRGAHGPQDYADAEKMRQKLIDAGVPPDRINMMLAPGQKPTPGLGGNFSAYTWDDMSPSQQSQWLQQYQDGGGANNGGYSQLPSSTPVGSSADPNQPEYNQVPTPKNGYEQLDDAHNPAAQAYARAALAKNGVHVPPGADAAAMWRDWSAQRAQRWAEERAAPNTPDPWQVGLLSSAAAAGPGRSAAPMGGVVDAARRRVAAQIAANAAGPRRTPAPSPHPAPATPAGAPSRVAAMASGLNGGFSQVGAIPALAANLPPTSNDALQRLADAARTSAASKLGRGSVPVI